MIDFFVIHGKLQHAFQVVSMLRQYSCLRSTRIFPTTIIISAAFAPRVSVIWHVFIVYMD